MMKYLYYSKLFDTYGNDKTEILNLYSGTSLTRIFDDLTPKFQYIYIQFFL